MAVQTTYADKHVKAYKGMVADMRLTEVISRETEDTTLAVGVAVIQGTDDNGVKVGAGGVYVGVTVRDITLSPDSNQDLFEAGDTVPVITRGAVWVVAPATVVAGNQVYRTAAGVLTPAAGGSAVSAAKSGGNTGGGSLTLDVTTPVLAGAKVGVYTVRCITAATDSGTFRVTDPDGFVIGDVAVGATFANDIKFAIADGAPDFVVGDGFDITVSANTLISGAMFETSGSSGDLVRVALR